MAQELATGYLSVAVAMEQGFDSEIDKAFSGLAGKARKAGQDTGKALSGGIADGTAKAKADLAAAERAVAATGRAAKDAADKQVAAARAVGIAEAKLNELRDSGKAKASALLAAEDRLAKAKTAASKASLAQVAADKKSEDAQKRLVTATEATRKSTEKTTRSWRDLASGMRAKLPITALRNVDRQLDQTEKKAGKLRNSFKGGLGLGAGLGAGFAVMGGIVSSLGTYAAEAGQAADATLEFKDTLKFAGVDTRTIDKLTKSAQTYADRTVYALSDIQSVTAQLASNGVKGYDKLAEAAGNLNAVAGGNAETFKSVGMVLTQTAGQGKLTAENWNQLSDAIPGASGKIQEALRKNEAFTGNFRDAMSKGQITAAEFNKALLELGSTDVAKQAATSTKTYEGAWGNLEATIVGGLSKILTTAQPTITKLMGLASDALGPAFDMANRGLQSAIAVGQRLSAWVESSGIADRIRAIFDAGSGSPLPGIIDQVRVALAGLGAWLVGTFWPQAQQVISSFIDYWRTAATVATEFTNGFLQRIQPILPQVKQIFAQVKDVVLSVLTLVKTIIAQTTTDIQVIWSRWGSQIMDVAARVFRAVVATVNGALTVLRGIIATVTALIKGDWSGAWAGIKQILSGAMASIKAIASLGIDAVRAILSAGWGKVKADANATWDSITAKVRSAMDGAKSAVSAGVEGIRSAWAGVKSAISAPMGAVESIINGLIDAYNKVASVFGAKSAGHISITSSSSTSGGGGGRAQRYAYATGGVLPGYTPGRDVHQFYSPTAGGLALSGGEAIMRPEFARMLGEQGIALLNAAAKKGKRAMLAALDSMGHQAFASGGIVNLRGHRFTAEFAKRIQIAEKLAGAAMQITQGGFRPTTSYSGTSHRGDALDITGAYQRFIAPLRMVGIPTWDRAGKGNWVAHAHGVPLPGAGSAAGSAVWQAQDYLRGGDGLGGRDNGPRVGLASNLGKLGSGLKNIAVNLSGKIGSFIDWVTELASPLKRVASELVGDSPWMGLVRSVPEKVGSIIKDKADSLLGFATGGMIRGRGTGTSDSNLIRASDGEYMVREWAASRLGKPLLDFINRFGALPMGFATGGLVGSTTAKVRSSDPLAWNTLAGAFNALQQAIAQNTKAQQASARAQQPLKRAQANLTSAQRQRSGLQAAQRTEDAQWAAKIAAARNGSASLRVKALRAEAAKADANLRAQIAAAEKAKNSKLTASLQNRRKATDAAYDAKIAKAQKSATVDASKVAALVARKKAVDLRQTKALTQANAKVASAQKEVTRQQSLAKPVTEKAAAAVKLLTDRQQQFAESQKALVDSARQVADSMTGKYSLGWSVNDTVAKLTAGAVEVETFRKRMAQLKGLGLGQGMLDRLEGQAQQDLAGTSALAWQFIKAGKGGINRLNNAQALLDTAGQRFGLGSASDWAQSGQTINFNGPVGAQASDVVAAMKVEQQKAAIASGIRYS